MEPESATEAGDGAFQSAVDAGLAFGAVRDVAVTDSFSQA